MKSLNICDNNSAVQILQTARGGWVGQWCAAGLEPMTLEQVKAQGLKVVKWDGW